MIKYSLNIEKVKEDTINGTYFKTTTIWSGPDDVICKFHDFMVDTYGPIILMEIADDEIYKHMGL